VVDRTEVRPVVLVDIPALVDGLLPRLA